MQSTGSNLHLRKLKKHDLKKNVQEMSRGGGDEADIKSNNSHLTGGEKCHHGWSTYPHVRYPHDMRKYGSNKALLRETVNNPS